ncbi:hypothetical protein KKC32_02930 [Patescibacteria group bacterium]|nr:hypothetical protein [Patescibacteria group bacterium]
MALENIIEELESGGVKKPRQRRSRKTASKAEKPAKPAKMEKPEKREIPERKKTSISETKVFSIAVAVIIALGIIGILVGYTKDKFGEIKAGGDLVKENMEQEVNDLKAELNNLREKTNNLEEESASNKSAVIDIFEKTRKIPTSVNAGNWNALSDENLSFTVNYPRNWEVVRSLIKANDKENIDSEIVYLQPTGQADFLNAVIIESDYPEMSDMTVRAKYAAFSGLEMLDIYDFDDGKMLYYINVDEANNQIPTIMILTEDKIYRATFNIANKKLTGYFDARKTFEEIVATFALTE